MGNVDEALMRVTGSTGERRPWKSNGETFVRRWSREVNLLVRPHQTWWVALVVIRGHHAQTIEVDGRDAAMEMAERAAMVSIHLRRFEPDLYPPSHPTFPCVARLDEEYRSE